MCVSTWARIGRGHPPIAIEHRTQPDPTRTALACCRRLGAFPCWEHPLGQFTNCHERDSRDVASELASESLRKAPAQERRGDVSVQRDDAHDSPCSVPQLRPICGRSRRRASPFADGDEGDHRNVAGELAGECGAVIRSRSCRRRKPRPRRIGRRRRSGHCPVPRGTRRRRGRPPRLPAPVPPGHRLARRWSGRHGRTAP